MAEIVIAEWLKNQRKTLRVRLESYHGRAIVDCRAWYADCDGKLKLGRSGLTVITRHLPNLAEAFAKSVKTGTDSGLIGRDTPQND